MERGESGEKRPTIEEIEAAVRVPIEDQILSQPQEAGLSNLFEDDQAALLRTVGGGA